MRTALPRVLGIALALFGSWASGVRFVQAQSNTFSIGVSSPAENTTLYAGPSSLLYSAEITGWVTTNYANPSLIHIRLEILRGTVVTAEAITSLRPDGTFAFGVTVNPDAPRGDFTIAEIENGCENCHYAANLSLPQGRIVLRLTATEPSGRQAISERNVLVDRSAYATVPIRVLHNGEPISHVPVTGATRLYLWRARHSTTITGNQGDAFLRVEALSQTPTQYIFDVEPTVIDGVLFEGVNSFQVTLPPGATSAPPVTLHVRGQMGKLSGTIKGTLTLPVYIHAILLPTGKHFSTQTSSTGTFEFPPLPIGSYLVMADDRALAMQGYSVKSQTIDLLQSPTTSITIALVPTQRGPSLQGNIHDTQGDALPFAWVALAKAGLTQSNLPDSGSYVLTDLPNDTMTVVASAPGYYHVAQVVDPIAHQIDLALTRRPETRSIAWGTGEIVVPPESQVFTDQLSITLEYGWLWGHGGTDRPLMIRVGDAEIVLPRGRFALEYLPPNYTSWLYVFEGDATVRQNPNAEPITIRAGEMIALTDGSRWAGVPIDPVVIRALRTNNVSPIAPQWEPTLSAQVRDWLAQMGIGAAQLTTLITYALILPTLALAPIVVVAAWRKRRLRPAEKT